jgi:hypothetical protein
MHSEMRRIDHAPAHEPTFQYDEQGGDSGFNEHDVNADENEGETVGIAPTDSRRTDSTNNVHAMPPLPERAPQSRAHDWHPSIARASAVAGSRSEAAQHPKLDNSWPSDTDEVMNPNAVEAGDWDGDTTEPDAVFSAEADSAAFNPEEPYNVSEDELEKIRRILDDLD